MVIVTILFITGIQGYCGFIFNSQELSYRKKHHKEHTINIVTEGWTTLT